MAKPPNSQILIGLIGDAVAQASDETLLEIAEAIEDYATSYARTWRNLMRIPFVSRLFDELAERLDPVDP